MRENRRIRRVGAVALVAAALAALATGCGSSSAPATTSTSATTSAPATTATTATTASPAATSQTDTIASFAYSPATIHVKTGGSVTFTNKDSTPHTATADTAGAFPDTGSLAQGQSKAIAFAKAGTFTFHCVFHPFMHGTVVVG